MTTDPPGQVQRWPRRAACSLTVLAVLGAFLAGCRPIGGNQAAPGNTPCSFGGLVLIPVVCIRAEPGRHQNGTWTYPASNPQAAGLHPGSVLIVARKSVRRVESVRRAGDQIVITTSAVPLTEVVKDGKIPLAASVTTGNVTTTVDLPPPPPPPEPGSPPPTPTPTPTPTHTSGSPVSPVVSVSLKPIRTEYRGSCSAAAADQKPEFAATFTVSGGPVTVTFHWTTSDTKGNTTGSLPGSLTFPASAPQHQTAYFTVPVSQYGPGTENEGFVSLQTDSPRAENTTEPQHFHVVCAPESPSPSPTGTPGSGTSTGTAVPPAQDQPARLLARTGLVVNGYQVSPSLALSKDAFIVDIAASRAIGPADLSWKIHGELRNFLSGGALHIVNHQLQDSGLGAAGLSGQVRFDWSLSAQVPESAARSLSLDLPIRLFVRPLLIGDFPVFLAVELHLGVGPEFTPGQALHGYASVSFSGNQGLNIHQRAIDRPRGPAVGGLHLDPGIRDLFRLPTLRASVDFPYISLGDDFYSAGAFLWVSPRMSVSIMPGRNPGLCARAGTDVSASAGTEFELFGLRAELTRLIFDRTLPPAVSFPLRPECTAG